MSNVASSTAIGRFGTRKPSELYALLVEKLPEHRYTEQYQGGETRLILDTDKIAAELKVRKKQTIYTWTKNNSIPAMRLHQFVELTGSQLTIDDLSPFATRK